MCADAVTRVGRQSAPSVDTQSFAGQLVTVKGGRAGAGAFVVRCIAVAGTTVSVVRGIEDGGRKAGLGRFADRAFAGVEAAVR